PRIRDHRVTDLLHRRASRGYVAVCRMPQTMLVVEDVVLEPAGCGATEPLDEMRHPAGLQRGAVQDVGVQRTVAGHRLAALHSIAGLRKPLPIAIVLSAVDTAVEAGELRPVRPYLGDVLDDRDGHHRPGGGRTAGQDEVGAARSRRG